MAFVRLLLLACAALAAPALAQNYPTKPIRMLIPFTAGSASDILARLIGPKLLDALGQQVVIDNRPSAGGMVAGGIVATATPDGHTLMLTSSAFAGSAALFPKMPYDSAKDFSGVSLVASNPLVLVVPPGLGVKSVNELLALARGKPGQINFASSGIGSGTHYGSELFRLAAKIDVVHVPYRGTPEALNDTLSGRIQYYLAPILPSLPLIREGRLLPLAVTTLQRAPLLPDVPTLAEGALPGFEYDGWFGVIAPSKTPRAIIGKLAHEIARIVDLAEIRERIASLGGRARSSTPEEFDRLIHAEIETRAKIFRTAGTKAD